ncbi:MAG: exodeoxyribonuclease VII small subunit [Planctomycetaceae bacterium]|nr:exodeoxyribonuclease VII small subunit [Planctomycetaceae bacterium]
MAKKKAAAGNSTGNVEAPPSFEQSLGRLQEIVDSLESGELELEQSLARYEEGVGLLRNCSGLLDQAELKISQLTGFDAEGNPVTAPFDASATHQPEAQQAGRRAAAGRSKKKPADEDEQGGNENGPASADSSEPADRDRGLF